MAQAARRGPDIIERQSIPLSATTDAPVLDAPAPPVSASNNADDQTRGVAKEITPQELAAAEAAKKADPATASSDIEDPAKPAPGKEQPGDAGAESDDDGVAIPSNLPKWATLEVAKIRKQYRNLKDAALAAAKSEVGGEAWEKAWAAAETAQVAKLSAERDKNARDAKKAQADLDAAMKEIEALKTAPKPEEPAIDVDPRPARDQFDDPDQYDEAMAEWGIRQGEKKVAKEAAEKKAAEEAEAAEKARGEAAEKQEAQIKDLNDRWMANREKAIERYPDYVEVVETQSDETGLQMSDALAAVILQLENGTDIAYYLASNRDENKRIVENPNPVMQIVEIGKVAERLANPARAVRRRPAPIEPLDTGSASADTTEAEPDMETYAARRNKDFANNRHPFFPPGGIH